MTFGPISIDPEYQRQGCGTVLLRESMHRAELLGVGAIAIEGNIGFYGKSGFEAASVRDIHYAPLSRGTRKIPYFLICELKPGFLTGVTGTYQDPEGYFVNEAEAERFDAQFTPREKQKLPGQLF
jgi:putative acetyltransferase